jgi:type VI secretion system protein ImpC
MSDDIYHKLKRVRPPRVQVGVEDEPRYGHPVHQLPFVVGVMTDLSGMPEEKPPLKGRQFALIDRDNFDDVLARSAARLALRVPDKIGDDPRAQLNVELRFRSMQDFEPARVAGQVPVLAELLRMRQRLAELLGLIKHSDALAKVLGECLGDAARQQALLDALARPVEDERPEPPPAVSDPSDWLDRLWLSSRLPPGAARERRLELFGEFVRASREPGQVAGQDVEANIKLWIGAIDRKLTAQLNEVLHHPAFQKLEATWRGLHYLVCNTNTSEALRIRVLNVSLPELAADLGAAEFDRSTLFQKVYEEVFGTPGGTPYGLLVGDYEFDCRFATDVGLLRKLAGIAAAAQAPFVAAVGPRAFGFGRWTELNNPRDIGLIFRRPEYAAWDAFRESEDSRFVALTMPRVLARPPYGEKGQPVAEFAFEEDTSDRDKYLWMSAAWCYAVRVGEAYDRHGWLARTRGVEGGGKVEGLPAVTLPAEDGGTEVKGPAEVLINDRRELELAKVGFLPLLNLRGRDQAAFVSAASCQEPKKYDRPEATANAVLAARLDILLCISLFTRTLAVLVRNRVGEAMEPEDLQQWLGRWITGYVRPDPESAPKHDQAQKPLAWADVKVTGVPGQPGTYRAVANVRAHYQLEPADVQARLVLRQLSSG